jgi:hypothetical protein
MLRCHGTATPLHPDNRYVPDKIRQQLNALRDLWFVGETRDVHHDSSAINCQL